MPTDDEIRAAMQAYAKWHIPEFPRPTYSIVQYMLEAAEKVRLAQLEREVANMNPGHGRAASVKETS